MCFIPIGIVILYSFRQMCNTYNKITDHLWKDILFEKNIFNFLLFYVEEKNTWSNGYMKTCNWDSIILSLHLIVFNLVL